MNDHYDGWKQYLDKELGEREEEIEILGVIEDLPRDRSEPLSENKMTLSTPKGPIVQEVTDEWRESILNGKTKKIVIIIRESIVRACYDYEGGLDYLDKPRRGW